MREHRSSHNKLARLGVEGGYLIPYLEDQGSGQDTGGGNPVADAIDTLVRRRYLIAGLFLLVVAITVAYTLSLPRLYEARSMVLVDLDQGSGRTAPVTSLTENIQFIRGKRTHPETGVGSTNRLEQSRDADASVDDRAAAIFQEASKIMATVLTRDDRR